MQNPSSVFGIDQHRERGEIVILRESLTSSKKVIGNLRNLVGILMGVEWWLFLMRVEGVKEFIWIRGIKKYKEKILRKREI